jgi:hypothetical protein
LAAHMAGLLAFEWVAAYPSRTTLSSSASVVITVPMPTPSEMLGQSDNVRRDPLGLEAEHLAELAKAGLFLVDDQQHAAVVAHRLQPLQPAGRRLDHAASAEQRLGDDRGMSSGGLRVNQLGARRRDSS